MNLDDVRAWMDSNPGDARDLVLQWLAFHPKDAKILALWWKEASHRVVEGSSLSKSSREEVVRRIRAGESTKSVADSMGLSFQKVGWIFHRETGKFTNDVRSPEPSPNADEPPSSHSSPLPGPGSQPPT